jgi:hypothetical protein
MTEKKLPKPTPAEYEKRAEFNRLFDEGGVSNKLNDEYLDLMNSYDWGTDLIHDGDKVGLKTALGEVILPPLFENFRMLTMQELKKDDKVVAMLNGKWGVIAADGIGTWILPPEFDYIGYPNNITHVCKDGKWGVYDLSKGEYLIPPECEMVYDNDGFLFCNRIGSYKKDGKYGVIADWGSFTEPIFEEVDMEPDGWVKVRYNGEWGFINEDNKFTAGEDDSYYSFDV